MLEFNQSRCGILCFVYDALKHNTSRNAYIKLSALLVAVGPSWEMGLPSESEGTWRVVSAVYLLQKHPPNEFIPVLRAESHVFVRTEILGQGREGIGSE